MLIKKVLAVDTVLDRPFFSKNHAGPPLFTVSSFLFALGLGLGEKTCEKEMGFWMDDRTKKKRDTLFLRNEELHNLFCLLNKIVYIQSLP